jgi:predicted transcriptional regulator
VLAALWAADQPLTPAAVRTELGEELAYTTVMTILARLHEKGVVTRERAGRAYAYAPAFDQADLAASRMHALLGDGRDRDEVLARFAGSLSARDTRTLTAALARRRRGSPDGR